METKVIRISGEIADLIHATGRFDDTYDSVLRRLLGLSARD